MIDLRGFRDALGRFATGVTIVTTADADGTPVGVTVSSYNSVSLDPPLVLWSLARTSRSLAAFQQAESYAIHVLGQHQQALAGRFASSGTDKFSGLAFDWSADGTPLLADCAAHFECRAAYQYEGGDHVIFVGQVTRFDKCDAPPLVFHQGRFTGVAGDASPPDDGGANHGRYTDDFLPYLLVRARAQLQYPMREHRRGLGLSESQYGIMGMLSLRGPATAADLALQSELAGRSEPVEPDLAAMRERGWVQESDGHWTLTEDGRATFLSLLSMNRAREEDVLDRFDPAQVAQAKAFLRALIEATAQDMPSLRVHD
jgi:3-hydroxy-9,10-secoandrosta-1,3,5(10)-triene-9,17-dione monooxygenase reductase component